MGQPTKADVEDSWKQLREARQKKLEALRLSVKAVCEMGKEAIESIVAETALSTSKK